MQPQQIHDYLYHFFKENDCEILNSHSHYMNVQLTIEMDKRIMNRPFYWRYIETVGDTPNPAQLMLITDITQLQEGVKGEVMHIGSPRLHQLFRVTHELGSFVKMYERVEERSILTPWLGLNIKVSYKSHQTKEFLYSLGMNLMTGAVFQEFHDTVCSLDLVEEPAKHVFQLPFIITPVRAIEKLERVIEQIIAKDDHQWAEEAKKRWVKDQAVLDYFYEGVEEKPESYESEKQAMTERFTPRISMEILNGGLFYLK
ncbi:hypothetical protein DV702_10755 [Sporosarcina sp. PTS2304]|uniref:YqhG family protein n=1 Tax=Sporosarcina sp. PTS2304 TaxID=2283194 RepID=UPI000E0D0326|nr:YqhG family protein [Sporosarcina sp. PTS2304]AXI00156.1 hypothetical protein DV702_10755 [Sporosarcina sp. PTS2304]